MGSTSASLTFPGPSSKIHSQDPAGARSQATKSGARSSSVATTAASKKVKPPLPGTEPPRCQVEGCKVDLSDAKPYYSRHKVCGIHSKSPKVVVGGVEQRFCQQCSRFHLLPEFDQGKRSCRRRLAGHNERRRKPPPGSLFSSRYGQFCSSILENSSTRGGPFLLNFTSHEILPHINPQQTAISLECEQLQQVGSSTGKYIPHPWQSSYSHSPSDLFVMQGSSLGTGYPTGTRSPSGECSPGVVSNPARALSLLSNRPWGHTNRASDTETSILINSDIIQPAASHSAAVRHFPNAMCFAETCSSDDGAPGRGLGHIFQSINGEFTGVFEVAQHAGMPYMDAGHSSVYDSTQQMHWSL